MEEVNWAQRSWESLEATRLGAGKEREQAAGRAEPQGLLWRAASAEGHPLAGGHNPCVFRARGSLNSLG